MTAHLFVDEAKRDSYLIVAAVVPATELAEARRAMRGLLLRNQRRIHFKDERDSRKRRILDVISGLPMTAGIYTSITASGDLKARQACLRQLIPDAAALGASRLVIERDDSVLVYDRQTLYDAVAKAGCRDTLRYDHLRAHEECLLWAADAVAWCWSHRSGWRDRVRPIVTDVIDVG
jgi:hypothetical protein